MTRFGLASLVLAAASLAVLNAATAGETLTPGNHPWTWQDTNNASVAAMIEQKKGGMFESGSGAGGSGGGCGGSAGNTTAIQNYTCIIINHSNANVGTTQDGVGNQTSTTTTTASVNGAAQGDLSTILKSLVK